MTIGDINVTVYVQHQDVSELSLTLVSPQGTSVTLHDQSGSGPNVFAVYDAERPVASGSMSNFDGQQAQGTWILRTKDLVISGSPPGTLLYWRLLITPSGAPVCHPLDCSGDPVPGEVPQTMTVQREGGSDLRFTWGPVAGADAYRVWRSTTPDFAAQELTGQTGAETVVVAGDATLPDLHFYLVHAVNSCEWQGP